MTPAQRYARCEGVVIAWEGGFVNNPKDPGGATNHGVTLRALEAYRGRPCTVADVRALSLAEVARIYRGPYWDAVRGDELAAGVDLMVFDAAVNTGRARSVRLLQAAVGVEDDGDFGPATLRAVTGADPVALIRRLADLRDVFYRALKTYPTFGRGWERRVAGVEHTALSWAAPPERLAA